jgi:Zn-dependent M32 family carboxypeptidase
VYRLLLRGCRTADVIRHVQQELPKETNEAALAELAAWPTRNKKTITAAIAGATDMLLSRVGLEPDEELALAINRLEDLWQEAREKQDTRSALAVQKELDSILQLKVKWNVTLEKEIRRHEVDVRLVHWDEVVATVREISELVCEDCRPVIEEILRNAEVVASAGG